MSLRYSSHNHSGEINFGATPSGISGGSKLTAVTWLTNESAAGWTLGLCSMANVSVGWRHWLGFDRGTCYFERNYNTTVCSVSASVANDGRWLFIAGVDDGAGNAPFLYTGEEDSAVVDSSGGKSTPAGSVITSGSPQLALMGNPYGNAGLRGKNAFTAYFSSALSRAELEAIQWNPIAASLARSDLLALFVPGMHGTSNVYDFSGSGVDSTSIAGSPTLDDMPAVNWEFPDLGGGRATYIAAAAGVTGTLSAQESGEDTFTGTGEVPISGTMSPQEAGADVFAASGAIEVSGTLAAQEAGTDNLSATGEVEISGNLAAQETGADNFTGSGTLGSGVIGTLSAQETGSDTLSGSGNVTVTGALAAQETGADTLTGSGLIAIEGGLSAQESGSDAFSGSGTVSQPAITGTMAAQESGEDVFRSGHRRRGGDDAPFRSSGQSRKYFYDKQVEELEKLERKVERLKKTPPKRRVEQAQIAFEPFQAELPHPVMEPLQNALESFARQETNYRQFRDAVSRYVQAVEQERQERRRRQNNDAAAALLFAA